MMGSRSAGPERASAGPGRPWVRLVGAAATLAATQLVPATTALPALRSRLLPGLSGRGAPDRVALTFDDGPDPISTPYFLDVLARHGVTATFFVLGSMLYRAPELGEQIVAGGHELAVHGWHHRSLIRQGPVGTYRQLARTRALITAVTGRTPRFFRPPYGVLTGAALLAARRLALRPVLWTCWGRDWSGRATPESVFDTVRLGLDSGGTILLHDADVAAAPGAWRATLAALPRLLDECAHRGWRVGPLTDHHLPRSASPINR